MDEVHAVIQAQAGEFGPPDESEWMLTDWVLVAKWVTPMDDRTWVCRRTAPGTDGLMSKGLLHEGLFGEWE